MITLLVAALLVVGVLLLIIEIITPGFGVVGGTGIALTLGGVLVAWLKLGGREGLVAFLIATVAVAFTLKYFPTTRAAKAMVLQDGLDGRAPDPVLYQLAGQHGVAMTPLRPSGSAEFSARLVDVVTEGVYVDAGTPIRVNRVEGNRVIVEPVNEFRGG